MDFKKSNLITAGLKQEGNGTSSSTSCKGGVTNLSASRCGRVDGALDPGSLGRDVMGWHPLSRQQVPLPLPLPMGPPCAVDKTV